MTTGNRSPLRGGRHVRRSRCIGRRIALKRYLISVDDDGLVSRAEHDQRQSVPWHVLQRLRYGLPPCAIDRPIESRCGCGRRHPCNGDNKGNHHGCISGPIFLVVSSDYAPPKASAATVVSKPRHGSESATLDMSSLVAGQRDGSFTLRMASRQRQPLSNPNVGKGSFCARRRSGSSRPDLTVADRPRPVGRLLRPVFDKAAVTD
jgi:hypothetical protein